MDGTHTFKVKPARAFATTHSSELAISPGTIRLDNLYLKAGEIEWIRLSVITVIHTGLKAGTSSRLELGNDRRSMAFGLHDMMYSTTHTATFTEIWDLIPEYLGLKIVDKWLNTLVSRGSFSVGNARFGYEGVKLPRKVFFVSRELNLVPWPRVVFSVSERNLLLSDASNNTFRTNEDLWKVKNACLVQYLVAIIQQSVLGQPGA